MTALRVLRQVYVTTISGSSGKNEHAAPPPTEHRVSGISDKGDYRLVPLDTRQVVAVFVFKP